MEIELKELLISLPFELQTTYNFVSVISNSLCGKIILMTKKKRSIVKPDKKYVLKLSFKNLLYQIEEGAEDVVKEIKINYKLRKNARGVLGEDNIVKMLDYGENDNEIWMVLEYAEHGDFYTYFEKFIFKNKFLKMNIVKSYFVDIVLGVYFLNKNGYSHRDISLENIFIHNNKNLGTSSLKLGDLGQAIENNKLIQGYCGKKMYQDPEILKRHSYYGEDIDVWALGVVLFMFISNCPLYSVASCRDPHFKLFKKQGILKYIKTLKKYERFEEDLSSIDLLRDMLNLNQAERITLDEILKHPFVKEEVLSRGIVFDDK